MDFKTLQIKNKQGIIQKGFYANGTIIGGVFFSALATIHIVRNSYNIAENIINELLEESVE